MNRLKEIREEAIEQEAYWRARRIGFLRIGIKEASDAGMTAPEAAQYLGASVGNIYNACHRFNIKLPRSGSLPRWRPTSSADIQIRETVKETALANRGHASAAQIAAAVGVSRNSIIGHWFRARQTGEVEA